jgi:hypothetical protein
VLMGTAGMAVMVMAFAGVAFAAGIICNGGHCAGTNGPDILRGTNKSDNLLGRGGGDDIYGWGARTTCKADLAKISLFGGKRERFRFSGGNKSLLGGLGNDYLNGGLGSDNLVGQEGNDLLWGGNPRDSTIDVLSGGDGSDVFFVYRELAPKKDVVSCGDGRDQVLADRADVLVRADCERVVVVHGSPEDIERQAANFYNNRALQRFFRGIRFPR